MNQFDIPEDEARKLQYPGIGLHDDISNDDYHGSYGWSSSAIKNYKPGEPVPRMFEAYHNKEVEFKSTEAMKIGTTYHKLMLEPDDFDSDIKVFPDHWKPKERREYEQANPSMCCIKQEQLDTVGEMKDEAMKHDEFIKLFEYGFEAEKSGWYRDVDRRTGEGTNMICKYRPDIRHVVEGEKYSFLGDLKTTSAGGAGQLEFQRAIQKYGYHISAAHYMAGERELFGHRPDSFIFYVQETVKPYLISVFPLHENALGHGRKLRRHALNGIKDCFRAGKWPHYNFNKASIIDLPQWVYTKEEHV